MGWLELLYPFSFSLISLLNVVLGILSLSLIYAGFVHLSFCLSRVGWSALLVLLLLLLPVSFSTLFHLLFGFGFLVSFALYLFTS